MNTTIVDRDISEELNRDIEFQKLSSEEKARVLSQLNGILGHTLYQIPEMEYNEEDCLTLQVELEALSASPEANKDAIEWSYNKLVGMGIEMPEHLWGKEYISSLFAFGGCGV